MAEGDAEVEGKPRFPTINQVVEATTGRKIDQNLEDLPIKPLPGTMGLKLVPERFSVRGTDAAKAAPEILPETNPTKPANPQEHPNSAWRAKLPQGDQGK